MYIFFTKTQAEQEDDDKKFATAELELNYPLNEEPPIFDPKSFLELEVSRGPFINEVMQVGGGENVLL